LISEKEADLAVGGGSGRLKRNSIKLPSGADWKRAGEAVALKVAAAFLDSEL